MTVSRALTTIITLCADAFAIDPISGEVTVAGTIDRESTTR